MIAPDAVRKAALLASVMDSRSRRRLLDSLEPGMAGQVASAMLEVRRHGWDRRELVDSVLPRAGGEPEGTNGQVTEMRLLAGRLDPEGFSRVLAAHGGDRQDFLLSLLDPGYAREVRSHLSEMPALPERLRAATLAAASGLAVRMHEGSR